MECFADSLARAVDRPIDSSTADLHLVNFGGAQRAPPVRAQADDPSQHKRGAFVTPSARTRRPLIMRRVSSVVVLMGVALLLPTVASAQGAGDAVRGESLAQQNCSTCHAVGRTGVSPYPLAPPFRTLHQRYDVAGLAEALAEGIVVGNTGGRQMPMFVLSVDEIEDL